jgi:hypothetical protein
MDDTRLVSKVTELRSLLKADHIPEGVVVACLRLRERPEKLFKTVFNPNLAEGASDYSIVLA